MGGDGLPAAVAADEDVGETEPDVECGAGLGAEGVGPAGDHRGVAEQADVDVVNGRGLHPGRVGIKHVPEYIGPREPPPRDVGDRPVGCDELFDGGAVACDPRGRQFLLNLPEACDVGSVVHDRLDTGPTAVFLLVAQRVQRIDHVGWIERYRDIFSFVVDRYTFPRFAHFR